MSDDQSAAPASPVEDEGPFSDDAEVEQPFSDGADAPASPSDNDDDDDEEEDARPDPAAAAAAARPAQFSADELRYFRKMFDMFDTDHSGAIGYYELKNLTKHLGVELTDETLHASMDKIDENGNGDLEFEEFLMWLADVNASGGDAFAVLKSKIRAQGTRPLTNAQIGRLRDVFDHFDADKSGAIDVQELGDVFSAMGQQLSTEELKKIMTTADDDGSGEMLFAEFVMLMCSNFGVTHAFDQDLLEGFHRFDPMRTGVITCGDLAVLVRELVGANLNDDQIRDVVDTAHQRGDGYVEYMEWDSLWEASRGIMF
jgi:calmodulin